MNIGNISDTTIQKRISTKNYDTHIPQEITTAAHNVHTQNRRTSDVAITNLMAGGLDYMTKLKKKKQIRQNDFILAPLRKKLIIPPERKCILGNRDGWKCTDCQTKDECCWSKEYICDGYIQCLDDDSDEDEGCKLLEALLKGS